MNISQTHSLPWLRSFRFDIGFILLIPFMAIAAGFSVNENPALFAGILLLDIWLLGYHHVISTFTRISFSKQQAAEHRTLLIHVPILVLAGTVAALYFVGPWAIATLYLYWQWFHYTRQSYGISRYYMSKSGRVAPPSRDINSYALYLLPLTGILYRSYQAPEKFLFMELKTLPVSYEIVMVFLALSIIAITLQIGQWIRDYLRGELSIPYALYVLSHHAIFAVGYLLIEDINYGWLALNIWHNAQYIAFVWLQNNLRYEGIEGTKDSLISHISQKKNIIYYFAVCLALAVFIYTLLDVVRAGLQLYSLMPMGMVIYMTINFHHYVVDAVIWKRRKKTAA